MQHPDRQKCRTPELKKKGGGSSQINCNVAVIAFRWNSIQIYLGANSIKWLGATILSTLNRVWIANACPRCMRHP